MATSNDNILMSGTYKDMPYSLGTYNWVKDPETDEYLFRVSMPSYTTDEQNNANLSEKELEKIEKAVQKAFSGLEPVADGMMGEGYGDGYVEAGDIAVDGKGIEIGGTEEGIVE